MYSGLEDIEAAEFPQVLHDLKCRVEGLICDNILDETTTTTTTTTATTDGTAIIVYPKEFMERIVKTMKLNTLVESKDITPLIFNYCLCNHCQSGEEYLGYHLDNESPLDPYAPITLLSFGITRNFNVRARKKTKNTNGATVRQPRVARVGLGDGDLLLMLPP